MRRILKWTGIGALVAPVVWIIFLYLFALCTRPADVSAGEAIGMVNWSLLNIRGLFEDVIIPFALIGGAIGALFSLFAGLIEGKKSKTKGTQNEMRKNLKKLKVIELRLSGGTAKNMTIEDGRGNAYLCRFRNTLEFTLEGADIRVEVSSKTRVRRFLGVVIARPTLFDISVNGESRGALKRVNLLMPFPRNILEFDGHKWQLPNNMFPNAKELGLKLVFWGQWMWPKGVVSIEENFLPCLIAYAGNLVDVSVLSD